MEATANLSAVHSHSKAVHSRSEEAREEALTRAVSGQTMSNYPAIYQGFIAKGIPESEIRPRENVFTFNAWRALGRTVRRGEHGVKVLTFIERASKETDQDTGERKTIRRPWTTTVFHVSQTDSLEGGGQ
jgi:antirestriction protein ArdC